MWFRVFVWHPVDYVEDYLYMWMDCSLCISHCVGVCVRVFVFFFPVCFFFLSFLVDWHLLHPSISLSYPFSSLSRPAALYDVCWTWRAANFF